MSVKWEKLYCGFWRTEVAHPGAAAFISFAAEAKLVRFDSVGTLARHAFPFGFNPGDATGTQGIGVCSLEVYNK